jgi:ribonuclease HII
VLPSFSDNTLIVGVDEAGRGCLAGPVYAGAVILNPTKNVDAVRDSKQMSESGREKLFETIITDHRVGIGIASVEEIATLNILNAALLAMKRAFENLQLSAVELKTCHVLVDGNQKIRNFSYPQTPVVKGDQLVKAIAAASIIAKVSRDRELRQLHEAYPQYGFLEHKGYATEVHRQAIAKHGPTRHHRVTFAGVREHVREGALL